jgi:hypothetical protein
MPRQCAHDQEFRHRQRQLVPLPARRVALQVEHECRGVQLLLLGGGACGQAQTAQQHLDARHELPHRERLAEVVVRSELEAEDAVELVVSGSEEDDRERLRGPAEPATELEAIHARHQDVEHRDVRQVALEGLPGLLAVRVGVDSVARAAEREPHRLADALFVVDDGDPGECGTHRRRGYRVRRSPSNHTGSACHIFATTRRSLSTTGRVACHTHPLS